MPEATVKQDIEILKKIQILDKELYDLTQELNRAPFQIKQADAELESAKKAVAALEEKVKQTKLRQKEKEGELAQKEGEIVKLNGQLGQVKTNNEYSAIQKEIAGKKADNSILEEAIIGLMDEVETVTQELNKGREEFKKEESRIAGLKADIKQKESGFKTRIEELKNEKKDMIGQVSQETSSLYERILAKKSGVALARIDGENCSACQMLLRPQVQNEVKLQEKIILCENCSRILYEESA